MELEDCIHPLVRDIIATIDLTEATKDADVVISIEDPPTPGIELKEMIESNASFMRELAESVTANASPGVKVHKHARKRQMLRFVVMQSDFGPGAHGR